MCFGFIQKQCLSTIGKWLEWLEKTISVISWFIAGYFFRLPYDCHVFILNSVSFIAASVSSDIGGFAGKKRPSVVTALNTGNRPKIMGTAHYHIFPKVLGGSSNMFNQQLKYVRTAQLHGTICLRISWDPQRVIEVSHWSFHSRTVPVQGVMNRNHKYISNTYDTLQQDRWLVDRQNAKSCWFEVLYICWRWFCPSSVIHISFLESLCLLLPSQLLVNFWPSNVAGKSPMEMEGL